MSMLFKDRGKYSYSLNGKPYAFYKLFAFCNEIQHVSSDFLPATILSENCYEGLFFQCGNLQTAPNLPATTLTKGCYSYMFHDCTSLVNAPELPATTLVDDCYSYMFYDCESLVNAPELPATTLVDGCYSHMFYDCTKLNYIKALFTTAPLSNYTSFWVHGVASSGTFVKNKNATWNYTGNSSIPKGWTVVNDVKIITFSIPVSLKPAQFRSYQAEEGMTWEEWVNSSYNNEGYYLVEVSEKTVIISPVIETFAVCTNGTSVASTDVIIEGYEYELF